MPFKIQDLLTPIGLAHWLMGDGYLHNGIILICSESFTKQEQELLIAALYSKFNIKATLNKRTSSSPSANLQKKISTGFLRRSRPGFLLLTFDEVKTKKP